MKSDVLRQSTPHQDQQGSEDIPQDEDGIRQLWVDLVVKSWEDDALRQRLLHEPAAVLKENGVEVSEGATVRTFEDDGNTIVLPVPQQPEESELSDDELESVAGGMGNPGLFGKEGSGFSLKSFGSFSLKADGTGTLGYTGLE